MNSSPRPLDMLTPLDERLGWDPLYAFSGVMWGSMVGGAFWLTVIALVLTA